MKYEVVSHTTSLNKCIYAVACLLCFECMRLQYSATRLAPVVKLNYAYSKVFFSLISQSNDG